MPHPQPRSGCASRPWGCPAISGQPGRAIGGALRSLAPGLDKSERAWYNSLGFQSTQHTTARQTNPVVHAPERPAASHPETCDESTDSDQ
jgi:hypothetical protein